jgi:hypothetical protein
MPDFQYAFDDAVVVISNGSQDRLGRYIARVAIQYAGSDGFLAAPRSMDVFSDQDWVRLATEAASRMGNLKMTGCCVAAKCASGCKRTSKSLTPPNLLKNGKPLYPSPKPRSQSSRTMHCPSGCPSTSTPSVENCRCRRT